MKPWMRVSLAMFVVGWGANQFSPLLLVYRRGGAVSESAVTMAFGAYALGLIPALLLAVPVARRYGQVRTMRVVLALSAVASLILLVGGERIWALVLGRLLAGIASGSAFGPGTAWIKELSDGDAPGAGARRVALALSAGFGGGPLVAGALAQWLSAPEVVPYLVHICLTACVAPLVWNASGGITSAARHDEAGLRGLGAIFGHRGFRFQVAPTAPLVFGAATTSFAVLPALVPPHGPSVAASGGLAGLTLASGAAVQPLARRMSTRSRHAIRVWGLAAGIAGFLLGAVTIRLHDPVVLIPAAITLGACYGMLMVAGLSRVEALAAPNELAGAAAVFYCLSYLGFAAPYLVTAVGHWVPPAVLLVCAACVVAALIPATALVRTPESGGGSATGRGRPVPCGTGGPAGTPTARRETHRDPARERKTSCA
ncbi:MFS transporter [Streptomyces sp. NPDC046994]|uniref:MFS transporter n=1 Tax=Streptomyces sp. NPDC046994 TaxID=3155735 RepID=UPI0034548C6B